MGNTQKSTLIHHSNEFKLKLLAYDRTTYKELESSVWNLSNYEVAKELSNAWWKLEHIGQHKEVIIAKDFLGKKSNIIFTHKNF